MSNKDVEGGGNGRTSKSYPPGYYSSYGESSEKKWRSWLIPMFVVVNIAVFIVTMFVNNCPHNKSRFEGDCVAKFLGRLSFQPLKDNPLFGPSTSALHKMGGLARYEVIHGHEGWRLVSCIWLHGGVVHLLLNMICLIFIGIRLEQQFGFVKVGAIYLLSGFGGAILSFLFLDNTITVGASGALFGLLGSMTSELLTNWTIYTNKAAALFTLVVLSAINLAVGIFPIIDNFSHIGGFLTGFLLGFVLLLRPQFGWVKIRHHQPTDRRVKSKYKVYQYSLFVIALILLIAGISAGLVMVFRGVNGNEHCNWCHYLDCVSTSKWKCDI